MAVTGSATITIAKALSSITVSPPSVTLHPTNTQQFTATGHFNDATTGSTSVTWSAGGGTITSAGLFTAGSTLGNYTVTATSTINPSLTATAAVGITASTGTGGADWVGDWETGNTSQYGAILACSGRLLVYSAASQPTFPAPIQGNYAVRLRTVATDYSTNASLGCIGGTGCGSPTCNPRCQANGKFSINLGQTKWYKFWAYFPTNFPYFADQFFTFFEWYRDGGAAAHRFIVTKGGGTASTQLVWETATGWNAPIALGTWHKFMVNAKWAKDNTGFVSIWHNDVAQALPKAGGAFVWNGPTLTAAQTTPLTADVKNYWKQGAVPEATIYQDGHVVGPTRASIGE